MDILEMLNVLSGIVVGIVMYVWLDNTTRAIKFAQKHGFKY